MGVKSNIMNVRFCTWNLKNGIRKIREMNGVLYGYYLKAERSAFINRFFDGALNQMVVSYLNENDLAKNDIDTLQAILDKKRKQ